MSVTAHPSLTFALPLACVVALAGCSSDDSPSDAAATCSAPGGPAAGPSDEHCSAGGVEVAQSTDAAACAAEGDEPVAVDPDDYGPSSFGTEADGDDCKYHVVWSTSPVCADQDVTITATVTSRVDDSPVIGGNARVDVFSSETHIAPNLGRQTTEGPPGTYQISPVQFDQSGQWTVRWHFFENCSDEDEESPHGHVSFLVDVP